MARTIHGNSPRRKGLGFSLIEVMVAVVILATGLLALAALQGALARNSSDAKARAAVMAALTSRMSEIRQAPPTAGTTWTMSTGWVSTAAAQAGTSNLQVVETIAAFRWNGTTYVSTSVTNPSSTFTRASLAATWTGQDGAKSLTLSSDLSSNIYGLGSGYPVNNPNGSSARLPIVRQDNPSNTAGVIPIVTGNQATAASNPQPIIEGADNNLRVGTSFDVLNYIPEGSTAKITKRFQTEVIKCRCQFGAAGYSVAGKAQWPAVWDGTTYSVYPGTGDAAGVAANAGEDPDFSGDGGNGNGNGNGNNGGGRLQSEQCTECCRDHHDANGSALEARYDPEASAIGKFNESSGVLTAASSGDYVAACRVVKVDGLWRTTADMYQRHYGLLETSADVNGTQAKSGVPSSSATSAYQTYVKDYLSLYTGSSTTAPTGAQSMFDDVSRGLNSPATITITTPSTSDYRYLHGRGLYVDYLTAKAQAAIGKCTGKTGTDYTECVLPTLPFTTINLTEMAAWTASDAAVLNINTTKALTFNVTEPFGGRTAGISSGTASNNSVMRPSNSGVAVSDDIAGGVDTNGDTTTVSDSQSFQVGGGGPGSGTGASFHVNTSGSTLATQPTWTIPLQSDSGNCQYDGTRWVCATNSTLPAAGTLTLSNYYRLTTDNPLTIQRSSCTHVGGGNANQAPNSWVVSQEIFTNYEVTAVSGAGSVVIGAATSDGKLTESTTLLLGAIPDAAGGGSVGVTFSQQGSPIPATVTSCTYQKNGNAWTISVVWSKSWL